MLEVEDDGFSTVVPSAALLHRNDDVATAASAASAASATSAAAAAATSCPVCLLPRHNPAALAVVLETDRAAKRADAAPVDKDGVAALHVRDDGNVEIGSVAVEAERDVAHGASASDLRVSSRPKLDGSIARPERLCSLESLYRAAVEEEGACGGGFCVGGVEGDER